MDALWLQVCAATSSPSTPDSNFKAILCNSPNCRSVMVVLQVFENPDNFEIGRIADDDILPGKLVPFKK